MLNHPSEVTVVRLVATVTSNGIMRVIKKAKKMARLKGKSRKANAYAARIEVTSWPATMIAVWIAELRR